MTMASSGLIDRPLADGPRDARARLNSILSGLSRHQWAVVRTVRQIANETRQDYVAAQPVDALTADALLSWEACIQSFRHVLEAGNDSQTAPPAKRSRHEVQPPQEPVSRLTELFQSEWFATQVCPLLTTCDACHLRATGPLLSTFVAGFQWDDLSCPIPFQHMHLWRKCFPVACGAHVVLPALPHTSIPTLETTGPHDTVFERFKGLRRLTVAGAEGYVISDAAFGHLAGIVELNMPQWGNIAQLTDLGLKHLSGVRKLSFTGTCSLHLTSEGFRHLAGIHSLQVVAVVLTLNTEAVVWQMTDAALSHLRGIRQLELLDVYMEGDTFAALSEAESASRLSDAGFAYLQGIQELKLVSGHLPISTSALSHLRGIVSLELAQKYGELVTDDTLILFSGIKRLTLLKAPFITDTGLRHLGGIQKLRIPRSNQITDAGFVHLAGIQDLDISFCPLVEDAGFQYLRGIQSLDMKHCPLVTDAAFSHLEGIDSLVMTGCDQEDITDKAFTYLAGIRSLDMRDCTQSTITSRSLHHLAGIQRLDASGCDFEVDTEAFSRLRSLTSLEMSGASLSTHLAALRVFQGNAGVESSLWQSLACNDAAAGGVHASDMAPFYDLATTQSIVHLLRAERFRNRGRVIADGATYSIAEVVLAAQLVVHVARSQLHAGGVVELLVAYICRDSWCPCLHWVCNALEVLCEYPEFAAQVFQGSGAAALASVLVCARQVPIHDIPDKWRAETCTAACNALCWVLHYHPEAGTVFVKVDLLPLLLTPLYGVCMSFVLDNTLADVMHSAAACTLVRAFVRTLAVSGSNNETFIAALLQPEWLHLLLLSVADLEHDWDLQDMAKSLQVLLTWGTDAAATTMSPTSVIVKLWDLHPEDSAVANAACRVLHGVVCCPESEDTVTDAHLHAMVAAGCIPSLVHGVRVHGVENFNILRQQVDILKRISCVEGEYDQMLRDAGAVEALRACRDAHNLAYPDDAEFHELDTLISDLEQVLEEA